VPEFNDLITATTFRDEMRVYQDGSENLVLSDLCVTEYCNMTVQVFRKCRNAAESPAALTLGLFGRHTAA
jgi:hypothetical protein